MAQVKCMRCKFAEWERTKAGRLHPNQKGRCTWSTTVQIPPSVNGHIWRVRDVRDGRKIVGGNIFRDAPKLFSECSVFQPTPQDATE